MVEQQCAVQENAIYFEENEGNSTNEAFSFFFNLQHSTFHSSKVKEKIKCLALDTQRI